ncbi:hypothetical protein SAMN05216223_102403 [Actinacidiphila yanglinensis]|uniref:Uncharacterized protein n=1 Tax=Actinacidiphila yanglinensis TaxID=310779 RepID=A0A1H5VR95_9ACTN|nr:hypothetical protein SAMN05216223_102403 [Actinacidiphila yanglinensis]
MVHVSRRAKITIVVLTGGLALLVFAELYGPSLLIAWADNPD